MRTAAARVVFAVPVTVALALGLWLLTLPVQAMLAMRSTPSPLPSPVDPWWWGPCLLAGVVAGIALASRRVKGAFPVRSLFFLMAVCVGAVVVLVPTTNEARFLGQVRGAEGDDAAKLRAGDQACDWLTGQPWGQPPGAKWPNEAQGVNVNRYAEDLGLAKDDPVEAMQIAAADPGWRYLCERQWWLHRKIQPLGD